MTLQIVTFKWGDRYTPSHVNTLFSMFSRNLNMDWQPVLITDRPEEDRPNFLQRRFGRNMDKKIRILPLWEEMRDAKLCGVRLRAFSEDMAEFIGDRFVWVDLDVVIVGDMTPLLSRKEDFIALRPPRPPMPINGSMVMMNAGSRSHVYENWNMDDYYEFGQKYGRDNNIPGGTVSDEGWMAVQLGNNEAAWTRDDGIYYFRRDLRRGFAPLPKNARMVIMNGKAFDPSNPKLQKLCPWISENWK